MIQHTFKTLLSCLFIGALFVSAHTHAAKVYKWIDADGNVQFSQHPPPGKAEELNLKIKEATPEASGDESKNQDSAKQQNRDATGKQDEAGGESADSEAQNKKPLMSEEEFNAMKQEKEAELRKKNCDIAQKRFATINEGGRLYEVDDKGERKYWDDDTRAAKLSEAQDDLQKWCQQE